MLPLTDKAPPLLKPGKTALLIFADGLPLLLHGVVQVFPFMAPLFPLYVGLVPQVVSEQEAPQLSPQVGVDALTRSKYSTVMSHRFSQTSTFT